MAPGLSLLVVGALIVGGSLAVYLSAMRTGALNPVTRALLVAATGLGVLAIAIGVLALIAQ